MRSWFGVVVLASFGVALVFGVPAVRGQEGLVKEQKAAQKAEGQQGSMSAAQKGMREMMVRYRMMMRTSIRKTSPAGLLALKGRLGLSEEQVERLGEIAESAREEAKGVLTPEQVAKLEEVPDGPLTIEKLHGRVQQMMKAHSAHMQARKRAQEKKEQKGESAQEGMHHDRM